MFLISGDFIYRFSALVCVLMLFLSPLGPVSTLTVADQGEIHATHHDDQHEPAGDHNHDDGLVACDPAVCAPLAMPKGPALPSDRGGMEQFRWAFLDDDALRSNLSIQASRPKARRLKSANPKAALTGMGSP